jgi:site-specific recombinase XerD
MTDQRALGAGDAPDLSIEEAADLFIRRKRPQWKGETERTYRRTLNGFEQYADDSDLESLSDLSRYTIGGYSDWLLDDDLARATIASRQKQVRTWLRFLEAQGLVPLGSHLAVDVIRLDDGEEVSDEKLAAEDARVLLEFYREDAKYRGTREHALLEVIWHLGPRRSCIRALDLGDYDDGVLTFRNRPESGTRLKRGNDHERKAVLSPEPSRVLDLYLARERIDVRDDAGRKPLFTSEVGRPTKATITSWMYVATQPCLGLECPHGRRRPVCSWVPRDKASKCPSTRGPHAIRRGSITWQRNLGISAEKVASRAATTPDVIRRYYDQPDLREDLQRRRADTEDLDIIDHLSRTDLEEGG